MLKGVAEGLMWDGLLIVAGWVLGLVLGDNAKDIVAGTSESVS